MFLYGAFEIAFSKGNLLREKKNHDCFALHYHVKSPFYFFLQFCGFFYDSTD